MREYPMRHRKAYEVTSQDFDGSAIVYAPTPAKAKGVVIKQLADLSEIDADTFTSMRVRRARSLDIMLPDEHWIVSDLSDRERQIVAHSYGPEGHRDHYCSNPGNPTLLKLVKVFGIFDGPFGADGYDKTLRWSGAFFYLTEFGKEVARSMAPTYPRY